MSQATEQRPHVMVFAGPNGAGKTTSATLFLPTVGVTDFVNADAIARGLSHFRPESAALQAGRIMLDWIHQLGDRRQTFAFETTLASRNFAPWIRGLRDAGYAFDLFFYWIPTPDMAVARVAQRVQTGGHHVPDETVRRRYDRGLSNFFRLYKPLATHWRMYDNSARGGPSLVAFGDEHLGTMVLAGDLWDRLVRKYGDEDTEQDD